MIYLDNGSTTPVDPEVVEAMLPFLSEHWGNPSSLHRIGSAAARGVQESREFFAEALGATPEEIVFTSGGTEADNLGVRGAALSARPKHRHALIFTLEHPAVQNQRQFLEQQNFTVEQIPCTPQGICDMDALEQLIRPKETALIAVMQANNEIGTVQPIQAIGELIEDMCPHAALHVDSVQSFTKMPVRPVTMGATSIALAGHKIHAPKGVGLLYVKKGSRLRPQVVGGGQERGYRAGTENVAGIVGFAKAAQLALAGMGEDSARMRTLRDHMIEQIQMACEGVHLNGHPTQRLCNNVNINVTGARAEIMLHALEEQQIFVSSGSACHAGQKGPSHVLKSIGLTERDTGCLRITLSRHTTLDDVEKCVAALIPVIHHARSQESI